jgi:hypothetical protein
MDNEGRYENVIKKLSSGGDPLKDGFMATTTFYTQFLAQAS